MCHVSLQEEKSKAYEVRDLPPKKNIIVKKSQYEASWLILGAIQPWQHYVYPCCGDELVYH